MKRIATRGNSICFGRFGFQAFEPAWITFRQIEVGCRAIIRYAYRGGKIWIRIFLDKHVIMWLAETCMGSGKKVSRIWVSVVKPNRIFYEISGVLKIVAKATIRIAIYKMPICTQFVVVISNKNIKDGHCVFWSMEGRLWATMCRPITLWKSTQVFMCKIMFSSCFMMRKAHG